MDKYKDPYEMYYKPYTNNRDSFGYGTYGYQQNSFDQNKYNRKMQYKDYNDMQIPIQIPEEDYNGIDEMDKKKMKAMYPEVCKKIQYYIDEECDKMEYDGSYMYDEYPEKEVIEMLVDKIYEKIQQDKDIDTKEFDEIISNESEVKEDIVDNTSKRCGCYRSPNRWLRNNIHVMMLNEVFGRRSRRCKRRHKTRQWCYYPQPFCPDPYYRRYPDYY